MATVYFPDAAIPFTRIYEPKNRSIYMSPAGKTSLVTEIPCQHGDRVWCMKDNDLVQLILTCLVQMGLINKTEIIDALVYRLNYAYPVLEIDYEENIHKIITYLKGFNNLKLTGRNARFMYSWIHDMMRSGKEIIQEYGQPSEIPGCLEYESFT
jgi:protoporphyrinogen oxidase